MPFDDAYWLDGSDSGYRAWISGQPTSLDYCVALSTTQGAWVSYKCDAPISYICKMSVGKFLRFSFNLIYFNMYTEKPDIYLLCFHAWTSSVHFLHWDWFPCLLWFSAIILQLAIGVCWKWNLFSTNWLGQLKTEVKRYSQGLTNIAGYFFGTLDALSMDFW